MQMLNFTLPAKTIASHISGYQVAQTVLSATLMSLLPPAILALPAGAALLNCHCYQALTLVHKVLFVSNTW